MFRSRRYDQIDREFIKVPLAFSTDNFDKGKSFLVQMTFDCRWRFVLHKFLAPSFNILGTNTWNVLVLDATDIIYRQIYLQ